jgi:DNA-binding transcriptional LysR family regulator
MTDLEIRYFLEIVDQDLNFTKASKTLYVSQPALTKHINTLNKELGVRLFNTAKKKTMLTTAGKLYYEFFSECRGKFKKVAADAKALADQKTGEISIICLTGWDMLELLPSKKRFCEKYPQISLNLSSGGFREIKNGILNKQYDLAVTFSDQFRYIPDICIHDLCRIPCIILFSSRHRLAGKENLTITDFSDEIFFTLSEDENPQIRQVNEAYCKSKGFAPRFEFLPNLDSILLALQTGSGYTIADYWMRDKDNPNFNYAVIDMFFTTSNVWKADNDNRVLPLFLKTCLIDPQTG